MTTKFIGFHYDIARGGYLKREVFHEALRQAAACGFTHFLPYLENAIRLPSMEKACPSCAYTADDWRAFEATARQVKIDLVPHFNVIGHTENICPHYPELTGGVSGHEIDPSLQAVRVWARRCLTEFCGFARSKWFLIGGDEWQPPQRCLTQPGYNTALAWVAQVNLAVDLLARKGRSAIVWHDMLGHFPEALSRLSRKAVIAFWFYDWDSDYAILDTFKKLGFRTIMASGVCGTDLDRRTARAVESALQAVKDHKADGFLMTTWGDVRWEAQRMVMDVTGRLLRCKPVAPALLEAPSLRQALGKVPPDSAPARAWRARCEQLLADKSLEAFSEYREFLSASLKADNAALLELYLRSQYPEGKLHQRLMTPPGPPPPPVVLPSPSSKPMPRRPLSLETESLPHNQTLLRIWNGDETFAIYPGFGATLQDWRKAGQAILGHDAARVLEGEPPAAGGYRSFGRVLGFRPSWALGTHQIPCVIWMYPYAWEILEESAERIVVELRRSFYHADIRHRVTAERGKSGFRFEALAVNRLPFECWGAFSWNLPILLEDWERTAFGWRERGQAKRATFAGMAETGFILPARQGLDVATPAWTLSIQTDPRQTAGYFVDWGTTWTTPDLHGVYRRVKRGQEARTAWTFRLTEGATDT